MAGPIILVTTLLVSIHLISQAKAATIQPPASIQLKQLGCFHEMKDMNRKIFPLLFLNYRDKIDYSNMTDLSYVVQACARAAVAKRYMFFAVQNYGECRYGLFALGKYRSLGRAANCVGGVGGLWSSMVYMVKKTEATLGKWSEWTPCKKTSGQGLQTRRRCCYVREEKNCTRLSEQIKRCDTNIDPVNGGWSTWSTFGECDKTCGRGLQTRKRTCSNPPPDKGGSDCKGPGMESQTCNTQGCPVNGEWSKWSTFGECDKTCGTGSQTRKRKCSNPPPVNGGSDCKGPGMESQTCNTQECPVNGGWSTWSTFGECDKTCGTGSQTRKRKCSNPPPINGGSECKGPGMESQACNTQGCPVNGGWDAWSAFGLCDKTCGGGIQSRSRTCTRPPPANDGRLCNGDSSGTRACNTQGCPVNGGWSKWSVFGKCDKTCGGGIQTRARSCTNPVPANYGKDCKGPMTDSQACNTGGCPVDGEWSKWSAFGECNRTCGRGTQTRTRSCTNPVPQNNGKNCNGPMIDSRACKIKGCPVVGGWSKWSPFGPCDKTCGGGTKTRTRSCTNAVSSNGKKDCIGAITDSQACNTKGCPVAGGWSKWSPFGSCDKTCGGGTRARTRSCTNPVPANYGRDCNGPMTESQACNTKGCPVDGGWSKWSAFGSCDKSCGRGEQSRWRACNSPPLSNGGAKCVGKESETKVCSTQRCPSCKEGKDVFDECGQRCKCIEGRVEQCARIRKEFTQMTMDERELYVKVIKTASTDPLYKKEYDNLIRTHRDLFLMGIHERTHFLPWHRWYILQYENILRRVDCRFTMAYWDWSLVSGTPFRRLPQDVWFSGASGIGGNGGGSAQCVQTGPFREGEWKLTASTNNACLTRNFNGKPPDAVAVNQLLLVPHTDFETFELVLRINLHDTVHCLIDGTMCTFDSSNAPEFFLHHGFIDKIWGDWQERSTLHKYAFFPSVKDLMPGTELLPGKVVDLSKQPGGVRVEYGPSGSPAVRSVMVQLRALNTKALASIPRAAFSGIDNKTMKMFRVNEDEAKKAKMMELQLQPKFKDLVTTSTGASPMEVCLGFKVDSVNPRKRGIKDTK